MVCDGVSVVVDCEDVVDGVVPGAVWHGVGLGVVEEEAVPPVGVVAGLAGVVVVVFDVVELGCVAVLAGAAAVGAGAAMAEAVKKPLAMKAVRISLRMTNLPCPNLGPIERNARVGGWWHHNRDATMPGNPTV